MKELKTKTLTVDEKRDLYEYLSSDSPEIIDKVEEIHEYIKELAQDFMRTEIWELNQKPELIGLIYQTVGIGLKWSLDYWLKFIEEAEKEAVERGSEEIKSEISSQITTYCDFDSTRRNVMYTFRSKVISLVWIGIDVKDLKLPRKSHSNVGLETIVEYLCPDLTEPEIIEKQERMNNLIKDVIKAGYKKQLELIEMGYAPLKKYFHPSQFMQNVQTWGRLENINKAWYDWLCSKYSDYLISSGYDLGRPVKNCAEIRKESQQADLKRIKEELVKIGYGTK